MSYLKKIGITERNGYVVFKNRHIPLQNFDKENIYEKIIKPLGMRKTKGTDYYDGKSFIKPELLERNF